jgi:hypothetical protein
MDSAAEDLRDGALLIEVETHGVLPANLFKQTNAEMAKIAPAGEKMGLMHGVQVKLDGQTAKPMEVQSAPMKTNLACIAIWPSSVVLGWQKGLVRVKGFAERWDRVDVSAAPFSFGEVKGLYLNLPGGRVITLMYDSELDGRGLGLAASLRDELATELEPSSGS